MPGLNKRNAFADKDGDDVDNELVYLRFVEKGSDQFTSADQPDILPLAAAKLFGETADCSVCKLDVRCAAPGPSAGEDVVLLTGVKLLSELETDFVGLAAH